MYDKYIGFYVYIQCLIKYRMDNTFIVNSTFYLTIHFLFFSDKK